MENLNDPVYMEFIRNKLLENIRKIEIYSSDGPIEDNKNKISQTLFQEQRKINQENQEEKSERERMINSKGINNELNV